MASEIHTDGSQEMAQIDGSDKQLIVRSISLPAAWSQVRVGVLWCMNEAAGGTYTGDIQLGLCSGTTNCYGDATTTHYVGAGTDGAQTWGKTGNYYWTGAIYPVKRVNTTTTKGTVLNAGGTILYSTATFPLWRFFYVDITKGSPNYSFRAWCCTSLNSSNFITKTTFQLLIDDPVPSLSYHTYVAAQTLAVDEGVDGTLNAVMLYHDAACKIVVGDIAAVVLA